MVRTNQPAKRSKSRQYQRVRTNLIAHLQRTDSRIPESKVEATIRDMSKGGAFIETPASMEIGEVITFDMMLPNYKASVTVAGVVRYRGQKDGYPGVGVAFLKVKSRSEDKAAIDKFVDQRIKTESPHPEASPKTEVIEEPANNASDSETAPTDNQQAMV